MQDENDVNSEEFAEEPLAAGTLPAARSVADRSDSPRAGDAVSGETNAEPKNIDGGPGPAAAQPEVVSPEETNAPVEDAEALAAAEAVGESVAEPVQDAGEPGPAAAQPEVVSPEDTLAPDAAEHDKAPAEDAERETLSPEEDPGARRCPRAAQVAGGRRGANRRAGSGDLHYRRAADAGTDCDGSGAAAGTNQAPARRSGRGVAEAAPRAFHPRGRRRVQNGDQAGTSRGRAAVRQEPEGADQAFAALRSRRWR